MVFWFYVKLTASRKTEQSDGKTKNIPQIQGFRMRYSKSNSSLPGLTITESLWRTSRVYHVVFPHIQLELNGKTVQFIGRDCIYWVLFVSQILSIAINQVCFHLLCCNLSLQSLHDVTNNYCNTCRSLLFRRLYSFSFSQILFQHSVSGFRIPDSVFQCCLPDLGSDASSVWNFCTHFSDVILWTKQVVGLTK